MIKVTIREAAKRRGYKNAYQFGQSVGLPRPTASRIWKNEQDPKLETIDRICDAWGCELDELIHRVGARNPARKKRVSSNGLG